MAYKTTEARRAADKLNRAKNREKINARARELRLYNLEHVKDLKKSWYHRHADEVKGRVHANYIKNRDKVLDRSLRRKYGVTLEWYRQKIASQNNQCAICVELMTRPCLDHNHITGQIREFLCIYCNNAIGAAKENPDVLASMIAYLKKHKQENTNVPQCEPQLGSFDGFR